MMYHHPSAQINFHMYYGFTVLRIYPPPSPSSRAPSRLVVETCIRKSSYRRNSMPAAVRTVERAFRRHAAQARPSASQLPPWPRYRQAVPIAAKRAAPQAHSRPARAQRFPSRTDGRLAGGLTLRTCMQAAALQRSHTS